MLTILLREPNIDKLPPPSTTTIKITIICTRFGKNLVSGDENAVTADHVTTSPLPLVIVITVRPHHYQEMRTQ